MFIDEKLCFTICFVLFVLIIYKPIRSFILSLLDSNINKLKEDFYNAEKLLAESK